MHSVQLRNDEGSAFFELVPDSQVINIVAPGGFNVTAPQSTFSGAVTVKGLFSFLAGLLGRAASGTAARISGAVRFTGVLTSNGKNISDSHTHGGISRGDSNTTGVNG